MRQASIVRVALVHYTLPPVIGGVERVASEHARLMVSAGHEVTVVCANASSSNCTAARVEIPQLSGSHPVILAAHAELATETTAGPRFAEAKASLETSLLEAFAGHDLAIVHNIGTMPFNLPATAALAELPSKLPGTRFCSWIHDLAANNPDYHIPPGYPWDLLRERVPGYEYVAVSQMRQLEWCELTDSSPTDCPIIPNGFDPVKDLGLSPLAARLVEGGALERELVLLHPCRLLRRKNVEFSLRITKALRDTGHNVLLLVTGAADPHHSPSAEYAAEITTLRDKLGLQEDVVFLGDICPVADADLPSLYQLADAVLLPSRQEGFGLPMLEAAAHRIPAFCSDIEPLRSLPGAIPFSLSLTPSEVGSIIIHRMEGRLANSPRKSVMRHHTWRAIHRIYLDPYLRRTNNHPH